MSDQPKAALGVAGPYSQAVRVSDCVYISGVLPLVEGGSVIAGDFKMQIEQMFRNLAEVAKLAGGSVQQVVKTTIYMTDLKYYPILNEVSERVFEPPYPARMVVEVAALPRGADIAIEAMMHISQ